MIELLRGFFQLVIWTFVPAMSSLVLARMYLIARAPAPQEYQTSARAGFWGGAILFLIVFVAQVGRFVQNGFPAVSIYQGFNPFFAFATALSVFGLLYGKRVIPAKIVGWLVLGVTGLSLWAPFHYLFIHTANEYILSLALGVALGVFAHAAIPHLSAGRS